MAAATADPPDLAQLQHDLTLDSDKLLAQAQQDRGDLYLLTWLTTAEQSLAKAPDSLIYTLQIPLTTSLLALVTPPSPTTPLNQVIKPGRPLRSLIARLLATLFRRGETKALFDVGQTLLKGLVGNDVKGAAEREKEWRVACGYVLGELWAEFGGQVMSLFIDVVTITTKIYRTSSLPVILRCSALVALRKAITLGAKSMSDQLIKETFKALKGGLGEKAGAVVREAAACLLALSSAPGTFTSLTDIDSIIHPTFKALESADYVTRRSLSRLIAGLLAHTQIEGSAAPLPQPKKKAAAPGAEEEDDDPYPTVGAPSGGDTNTKTLLSPLEMLVQLSAPYNKASSSRRLRNGIIDVYAELFTLLGGSWIEHYYDLVVQHLISEIGCGAAAGFGWSGWNPRTAERTEPAKARYEALAARKAVGILLRDVISGRLLSESGQISALRELGNSLLKKWPSLLPSQPPPSKQSLLLALEETSSLLRSLGCAPQAVQEVLYDPLTRLVSHPSHSVQITAAIALRTFCNVAPTRLSSTLIHLVDLLNKDLSLLSSTSSSADVHRRALGHAHALAALINLIPHQPLYVSFDLSAKCMSLAINLLKQSSSHELHISGIEIQVAWILVGALMSLGPNFVRLHLPQLLILWRNALPKPTSKETSQAQVRGENEWAFLLHIRECTLGAILSFLRHNSSSSSNGTGGLVNDDTSRRLVLLLSNALSFHNTFLSTRPTLLDSHPTPSTSSRFTLFDRSLLLRRRLLQCFVAMGQNPSTSPYQIDLLKQVVGTFSDPEKYVGEAALQAAVSAAGFVSVWEETDGLAFGVGSSLLEGGGDEADEGGAGGAGGGAGGHRAVRLNRDYAESKIDEQLRLSILGAAEHDPLVLSYRHHTSSTEADEFPSPPPPAVGLVDASISLFALYFTLQESGNQSALLQIMSNNARSGRLEKNPGRRMAIQANSITAVVGALRLHRKNLEGNVGTLMRDIIKESLLYPDALLRQAAAESLGRLSELGGTSFMAAQIQFCVTQVVNNTDPSNRAGCALAFGQIYSHVGSLAAGPVLKTIVDVLLSLSADPHPLVHFHALQALSLVIDAASLSYAPFTNQTLGLLSKLYLQDTHEPEGGTPGSVNLRGDLPAYQAICRVADALIGVLGPELQESDKVRDLILILLREFVKEPNDDGIAVEAIKATQHFLMFAPDAMDHASLVSTLRSQLSSSRQPLKVAAVNSVYQLVQRDAALMSKLGGDGLVQELFALLDDDPRIEGVRHAITSWLRQTADANPSGWIDLCQRIMSRSTGSNVKSDSAATGTPMISFVDEESQGLGLEAEGGARPGAGSARTSSRWRTQLFALQCLHEVFLTVRKSGRREHFDIARARALRAPRRGLLISRVGDLIKMAFTASTAQVMEIRLEGLVVLRDVIENFGRSQDLDFEEALLLDQYQAPIAAALTPAFAADSYPEVLASAIQVCAVFVGSGVVKEIEKMGRILKLLTTALESCKESDMSSLGDVKDLSSTAAVMLKTSIFAAWAQFQTASVSQPYLDEVIRPHLPLLCPFWVASLREYARVRTDPDAASSDSGAGGAAFDSVYSGLSRETALPFYERSWPQMLHAVGTLLKTNNPHMLRAVDGLDTSPSSADSESLMSTKGRDTPALFFWVLFGLSFEALCGGRPSVQAIALDALVGLMRTEVSGPALLEASLFEEVCNLCYRLAITEGPEIKQRVMEIVLVLAGNFAKESSRKEGGAPSANGSDGPSLRGDAKMTQCLRVATCVLRESIPSSSSSHPPNALNQAGYVSLIKSAFSSFADLADLHPQPMREELYAIAFHFYSQLLRDESVEVDLVSPTLPALKSLCDRGFHMRNGPLVTLPKVVNGMLSACLQNVDGMRGRQGPAAALKTRNNLLAGVLLLTTLPSHVKVGQEVVEHACFLITDTALTGDNEVSTTALHCLTSLLAAASRGPGVLQFCVGQLLPGLIEYIARAAEADYASGDARLVALAEVLKAFVGVLSSVPIDRRTQSLSILLPVLILLLSPSTSPPIPPCHTLAITHLLQLAAAQSVNFKEATAALGEEQRKLLESSIRAQVGGGRKLEQATEAPKISLKSFG